MHNRSICFPYFNSDQRSEAANRHVTDLSLMHLRDTDNWLSNTTRPIGANYRPTNKWSRASADAIMSQVGGRYRHVGGIFSLEWTSRCLFLGRTEPNIGSMADAFDLEFRRMVAISGRNLRRTSLNGSPDVICDRSL